MSREAEARKEFRQLVGVDMTPEELAALRQEIQERTQRTPFAFTGLQPPVTYTPRHKRPDEGNKV